MAGHLIKVATPIKPSCFGQWHAFQASSLWTSVVRASPQPSKQSMWVTDQRRLNQVDSIVILLPPSNIRVHVIA